jgi:hypothetical protein
MWEAILGVIEFMVSWKALSQNASVQTWLAHSAELLNFKARSQKAR